MTRRTTAGRALLGLAAAGLLAGTPTAEAATPRHLLTAYAFPGNGGLTARAGIATDLRRYVAAATPAGIRVLDSRTRTSRPVAAPAGCEPVAVGAGHVLINCTSAADDAGSAAPRLAATRGGASRVVPGWRTGDRYTAIGPVWLRGTVATCGSPACDRVLYLNWRTGRRVVKPSGVSNLSLADPALAAAPPAPPRVALDPAYNLLAYNAKAAILDLGGRLILREPGRPAVRIGASLGACCLDTALRLGDTAATWVNRGIVHRTTLGTRRTSSVRLTGPGTARAVSAPLPAATLVARPTGSAAGGATVYDIGLLR